MYFPHILVDIFFKCLYSDNLVESFCEENKQFSFNYVFSRLKIVYPDEYLNI